MRIYNACQATNLTPTRVGCQAASLSRVNSPGWQLAAESAKFATANPSGGGLADIQFAARDHGLLFALMELFP
jgi:hypothetical protein